LKQYSVIIFEGTSVLITVFLSTKWLPRFLVEVWLNMSRMPVLSLRSWHSTAAVTQIQRDPGEAEHEHTF